MASAAHAHALGRALSGFEIADVVYNDAQRKAWANTLMASLADYPDQMELARDIVDGFANVAAFGPRRSGKTHPIILILAAMCTVRDNFTVRILSDALNAPTRNMFERRSDGGLLQIMKDCGLLPGVCSVVRSGPERSVVGVTWPWGSSITVESIGTVRLIGRGHGAAADRYWIDETTKTPLAQFAIKNLVGTTLADSGGSVILSFTPDDHLDSLPGQIATGADTGYRGHWFRPWRNPHFGATFAERWARLIAGIEKVRADFQLTEQDLDRMRGLDESQVDAIGRCSSAPGLKEWAAGLDEQLQINFFGRWIRVASAYVYHPFHSMPDDALYWCDLDEANAARVSSGQTILGSLDDGVLEQRLDLLPKWPEQYQGRYEWRAVISADIGYRPDAYAETVKLWAPHHPVIYELHSYKEHELLEPAMFDRIVALVQRVKGLRIGGREIQISKVLADLVGMMTPIKENWHVRLKRRFRDLPHIGVSIPRKTALPPRRLAHNLDLSNGRLRYIRGGVIDAESRHLRYRIDKPAEIDKDREVQIAGGRSVRHGNDGLTAGMYADAAIPNLHTTKPSKANRKTIAWGDDDEFR